MDDERSVLATRFEANRGHLRAVAYRMLGSRSEAEDAVQEAWLRLASNDAASIENLRAWLTTVVARVCLDMLRARKAYAAAPLGPDAEAVPAADDTERDSVLADSIGVAMLTVLERLSSTERVAFVLHDLFSLPFEEIAPIIGRSLPAARQLASRARRRLQGGTQTLQSDRTRQREIVGAFLSAARGGDFAALLGLLAPDALLQADEVAVQSSARAGAGAPPLAAQVRGAEAVANIFVGRAHAAQVAWLDEEAGLVFAPGGQLRAAFEFIVEGERVRAINIIGDPVSLGALQVRIE